MESKCFIQSTLITIYQAYLNRIIHLLNANQDQEFIKDLIHEFEQSKIFLYHITNCDERLMFALLHECEFSKNMVNESRMTHTFLQIKIIHSFVCCVAISYYMKNNICFGK